MMMIYWPVRSQMYEARFRNISNLDLVEPNRIRDSIYVCIKSLFGNFFDVENVAYMQLLFNVTNCRRRPVSRSSTGYLSLATISRRILRYISCTNTVYGLSLVQKMFQDQTEVMLERTGPVTGTGPVLSPVIYRLAERMAQFFVCLNFIKY